MHKLAGNSNDTFSPENLITGEKQVVTKPIVVEDGEGAVAKYRVMGRIASTCE
jgi:hypothetical protein